MSLVQQIGYMAVAVSDMDAWAAFTTDVLGLVKASTSGSGFNLRMDEYQQRFFVEQGTADDVTAIGFEVADELALHTLQRTLEEAGTATSPGSESDCSQRGVRGLIACRDPAGVPLEFYYGLAKAADRFVSPQLEDGFVAGEQGFGHVVVACNDPAASEAFYLHTLGFRLSDTIVLSFGASELKIVFTHVNARHHSLAFSLPLPKRIHHFMVQAASVDDVGRALDRAVAMGLQVTKQLGRHSNDRMLSFYAMTPSGFEFEFGADAVEIDDEVWRPVEYDQGSIWGHQAPQSAPAAMSRSFVHSLPVADFVELEHGLRMHYHDQGDSTGAAVIFLHGSGQGASGWSNFRQTASALRDQGYRTLLPDLLGFGYSSKPEDAHYTLAFHEAALAQFISVLGLERVTLVGNSLGGALALSYALHHPTIVANLVLLAPGGLEAQEVYAPMPGLQAMFRLVMAEGEMLPEDLEHVLRLQLHNPSLLTEQLVGERWQIARSQPKAVWTTMQVPYLADDIADLRCPMLVFWGEEDQFLPVSGAQQVLARCPHAVVEILPQCGHWVMIEQRERFTQRCLEFLAEVGADS